ncbi:leucine-rich repeat-containing protein 40-like [Teleopsis dalmanni]|uniref:leucine-rich repeat-containing protein 40-like n=1 Tax=Teleopsis dalmanni TaxID=139649 RepID=UPI0018CD4598|nr:leucine-rich repeat-containing protein 40-like [Teleopsis dalmanni]XP_037952093.1 leucine-rich repeat-containing protein 40-like [Teleopsis dalmanni]
MDGLNSPRIRFKTSYDETVYPSRDMMRRQRILSVKNMGLQDIPADVFRVANEELISIVDLSKNLLDGLPNGIFVLEMNLSELNLSNNLIRFLSPAIAYFKRLVILNLCTNGLTELPDEFAELTALADLNLSSNRFEDVPNCIYKLPHLEVLSLADNHIKIIDPSERGFGGLKSLLNLDLSNNHISQVPPTLGNLTNIVFLCLIGNPFRNPRHSVLEKGTKAVLAYLRNLIPSEDSHTQY